MSSSTHVIPTPPHTYAHALGLLKKALLVRRLAWYQRLSHGLRSVLMTHQHPSAPWLNNYWDAAREQVRPEPAGNAIELHARHTRTSLHLLLSTLWP
jgi:hypothetical protein